MIRSVLHRLCSGPPLLQRDDYIGVVGSVQLLSAYYLSVHYPVVKGTGNWTLSQHVHQCLIDVLNCTGAAAIAYNCYKKRAWPPMLLEVAWSGIAVSSLYKHVK